MPNRICPLCNEAPLRNEAPDLWRCMNPRCDAMFEDGRVVLPPRYTPRDSMLSDAVAVGIVAVGLYALLTAPRWLPDLFAWIRL